MENHSADQIMILSMKISCCESCPKILKKKLLKMDGVDSAEIDTEKDLVYVTGTIHPTTLLNKVAKLGKAVQLMPTDETARKRGKTHKNCCCEDGRHSSKKKVEEEEHKCEPAPYPTVDARVCKDMFCKTHAILHKINHTVPPEKTTPFGLGWLPFYRGVGPYGGGYGGGSYPYRPLYGNQPHPYWYAQHPRLGPQYPFGPRCRQ